MSISLREIIRRTIFIGFGIQILLGIGWFGCALTDLFARTDSAGECAVCLLRFLLAWFACAYFLESTCGEQPDKWRRAALLYSGLGMATFPMALQCVMTSDGKSAATSMLLLAAACAVRVLRGRMRKPDCILLCAVAVAAGGAILISAANRTDAEENSATWLASRFAWSTLEEAEKNWPEELTEAAEDIDILLASYYPEELERTIIPKLEEKLGTDGATEFLVSITKFALQYNPARIAKDIIWDAAGYTFSPIIAQLQLVGRAYESRTGSNYADLLSVEPYLGELYFDYGCKWYTVLLGMTLLLRAAERLAGRTGAGRRAQRDRQQACTARLAAILPWLAAGILVVYCTMRRGGLMDYRSTVYVIYLVLAGCMQFSDKCVGTQEQGDGDLAQKE